MGRAVLIGVTSSTQSLLMPSALRQPCVGIGALKTHCTGVWMSCLVLMCESHSKKQWRGHYNEHTPSVYEFVSAGVIATVLRLCFQIVFNAVTLL